MFNKADVAAPDAGLHFRTETEPIVVSARTGEGVEKLEAAIASRLRALDPVLELVVPYDRGDVLAALHREGEVLVEVHDDEGTRVRARIPDTAVHRFAAFVVDGPGADDTDR